MNIVMQIFDLSNLNVIMTSWRLKWLNSISVLTHSMPTTAYAVVFFIYGSMPSTAYAVLAQGSELLIVFVIRQRCYYTSSKLRHLQLSHSGRPKAEKVKTLQSKDKVIKRFLNVLWLDTWFLLKVIKMAGIQEHAQQKMAGMDWVNSISKSSESN